MPGILSTNNPVVKVSGLRPLTLTTGLLVLVSPEVEKKTGYMLRTIQVEKGSFTAAVFSTSDGMG